MGSFSSKKTTKTQATTTTAPTTQYAPYTNEAVSGAQDVYNANKAQTQDIGAKAMNVYNGLAGANNTAAGIANGTNPAQAGYASLINSWANDPSKGFLSLLAQGSASPGDYNGIGENNPALGTLQGMTSQAANPDSAQFYKDTLAGKYLNNNPYLDAIAQQGTDAATRAANARFAASGMGEGLSTAYADTLGRSVADANNTLRYGAYNDELQRMGQIGGLSDAQYNSSQDRSLAAANSLGALYNQTGQLKLGAQQAKDAAFQNDRASQLAAGQALGSQYNADNATSLGASNANVQSILNALGLQGSLGQTQIGALSASSALPYANTAAYADLINSLTGRFNTTNSSGTSVEKSSPSLVANLGSLINMGSDGFSLGKAIAASDRRLKTNISRVGEMPDGLGVYQYHYVWGGPLQTGVMADEVATLRPWALGPSIGGYATVDYGAL